MTDSKPATPSTRIDPDLYRRVKAKTVMDGWSIAGLIREAFALYLNGEITKPDETPAREG